MLTYKVISKVNQDCQDILILVPFSIQVNKDKIDKIYPFLIGTPLEFRFIAANLILI